MSEIKLMESLCEGCSEPLFLSKKECRDWIANKLKQGYIVCKCCGAKQTIKD
jgi:RNase P subunit RPR2